MRGDSRHEPFTLMTTPGTSTIPPSPELLDELANRLGPQRLQRDALLAPYTSFRIGGPADLLYDAVSPDALASAVLAARELGVPYFVLGLGANILVGDRGVRGLVIRNVSRRTMPREFNDLCLLRAESGTTMLQLIKEAVHAGWSGLEHFVGIPSTVGGALWQNLHFLSPAPERERTIFIEELLDSCELLLEDGTSTIADREFMRFGYDTSVLHERELIVLNATFRLTRGDAGAMHRVMQENLAWRGGKHPCLEWYPSAGSIFRKIEGIGAGRLVAQCGLMGHRVGQAQISHLHANIIVNLGGATASDVRTLIATAQRGVRERFGHELQPEIGFIGEF